VHWEIVARDPERLAAFYRRLFQLPGTPTLAVVRDPEGNQVMLVQQ
jgi:predicted enzyme related to lactoylglutathione lyase